RASLRGGLLGAVHDGCRAGFQLSRKERGTAGRAALSAEPLAAVMSVAMAAPAIESATSTATIGASATISTTAAIPAAAKWPLEAGTATTADASGITRSELFTRACMRSAGFAGKENGVIFGASAGSRDSNQ